MTSTIITCPHCQQSFEMTEAIQHQIENELHKAKNEQSETLRKEYDAITAAKINEALEQAKLAAELETEKLRSQAEHSKANEKLLREQQKKLLEDLHKADKAREEAELTAHKELLEKEKLIRAEAITKASENFNLKIREQEETISKLREQLTSAKQVAEQGSQQLQGEVLELDIEQSLRQHFPYDTVTEVKKGERGSDIRQVVNEPLQQNCGLILWECKNAKTYQAGWLAKLKDELVNEKAQMGVLVFNPADADSGDFQQLADNIWLIKPRHAMMLAALLREVCLRVHIANRNAEGKEVKTEMLYNYLMGGEFNNRIRYIIESFEEMAKQLDTEKKQAQKRWAAQEKNLEKVISSLYGMGGDLQGIAGQEVILLPEIGEGEE
jgi:hypothetical protein